ncbi:hypothetical protein U879_16840 [Defluviimonas sp. 20V17]|uniref:Uncharacterized protein n=1 Tax=Allgaiera indica TaxID=765699 RepID=A0AAN4ZZD6_9RHOB|nr:hypothetical protein [Allgaiera indica]KDB02525.1 hypothetical protein U879_16840 [Defluviimonas sp. 20V17]GHE01952.1 hypothetical protein GCM10008024_19610 [Allgaiera indica]SDX02365.1 hypothetical protein SAMN05444006_10916 [Allgaiera indica]
MGFSAGHEIFKRRLGRNLGLGGALLALVVLIFALTIVKVGDQPKPVSAKPAAASQGASG